MIKDSLGDRMKQFESISQNHLMLRTPVIIRIDGVGFSKLTRTLQKPFDDDFRASMAEVTKSLCDNIQGAVFGYTQSDEISILLQDWKTLTTDRWFANNVQKIVSVSASMATAFFARAFKHSQNKIAFFDARAYNLPKEEVVNYFVWRQKDATRNSINSLAQSKFSHKELHGKNTSQVQDMLMVHHNINWNDLETRFKRGICVIDGQIDLECPIFTQDRGYIEKTFTFEEVK